ncbi:MAG: hypothetical protein ACI4NO_04580 [Oxalobacter sp.]
MKVFYWKPGRYAIIIGIANHSGKGGSIMGRIINEAGKKAIADFVCENLAGNVSDQTIQSYIDMAESRMKIYGGLPSLEITMCCSLSGDTEYLELSEDEVTETDD